MPRTPLSLATLAFALALPLAIGGCTSENDAETGADLPVFSLAWSEYPSWSVFGVADERGLINGDAGAVGPLEKKHGVDIELVQADYDTCLVSYGQGTVDAVCITNMDILNPALSRRSVAILPTSRSHGADALIVIGIDDLEELKKHDVYGLDKSVSEYAFVRNLQELANPAEFNFVPRDPQAAATAMQTGDATAIMVWNPFVMQTLKMRSDARRFFDSSAIPGEIIDMVVVGADSLGQEGGEAFAAALQDTYYEICRLMADPATEEATLVALGAKFSDLDADAMREVVKQTIFYSDPAEARALFTGNELPATMDKVVDFCIEYDIVGEAPAIAYGAEGEANLRFDPSYIAGSD